MEEKEANDTYRYSMTLFLIQTSVLPQFDFGE
jgi:hypothetical protein